MNDPVVTVFGGTGFLGRHVVASLASAGYTVRVAARYPEATSAQWLSSNIEPVQVDIQHEEQVHAAVQGAHAVVNAVSLFVEKGPLTFDVVHVQGAARVAKAAREAGVQRLIHVSGLGIDANSPSRFVRSRASGEEAVLREFSSAVLLRPSVMCGREDAFLSALDMATRAPVVPLFGHGDSRLQPVFVEDAAAAVERLISTEPAPTGVFELGGERVYTYREAVEIVMRQRGRKRLLLPVPFPVWSVMAHAMALLPNPPLTQDQLILMQQDNVVETGAQTFADLTIQPRSLEDVVRLCWQR